MLWPLFAYMCFLFVSSFNQIFTDIHTYFLSLSLLSHRTSPACACLRLLYPSDASVIPAVPSGSAQATVQAVAWRWAELLLRKVPLRTT
jgi:cell shape-determining protein MreD